MATSKDKAARFAAQAAQRTGLDQVIYKSQSEHFLYCSLKVWEQGGQGHISGRANLVEIINA